MWEKGEQVLSCQRHGVALTTCELGNGALFAPFPDRARILPREMSRHQRPAPTKEGGARFALRRRGDSLSHATAINCGWHDSFSRGGNRAAPLPTHLLRICAGALKWREQCAISKFAGGKKPTGLFARKRLLTPKEAPKYGILQSKKALSRHLKKAARKNIRQIRSAESRSFPRSRMSASFSSVSSMTGSSAFVFLEASLL